MSQREGGGWDCLTDIRWAVLVTCAALAALWDWELGRIPNRLLAVCFLLGFVLEPDPLYFLRGIPLILLSFPLAGLGMLGAGDGKLLGVIGCYLGFFPALQALAVAGLLAVLASLCIRRRRRALFRRLSGLFHYLSLLWRQRSVVPYALPEAEGRIPLAVPLLGGLLAVLFWKGACGA